MIMLQVWSIAWTGPDKVRMSGREGRRTVREVLQHQGQIQSIDWTFSLAGFCFPDVFFQATRQE